MKDQRALSVAVMVEPRVALAVELFARFCEAQAPGPIERLLAGFHSSESQATFRRQGAMWHLGFGGEDGFFLPDRKGLGHIHQLMTKPNEEVPALLLAAGPESFQRLRAQRRQELLDNPGRRDLRNAPDVVAVGEYLRAGERLGGRSREFADAAERARCAVTQAVASACRAIAPHSPSLREHLKRSIFTGNMCLYRPMDPIDWRL
jgi:hypothetical protein